MKFGTEAKLGQLKRVTTNVLLSGDDQFVYCGTQTGDFLEVRPWVSPDRGGNGEAKMSRRGGAGRGPEGVTKGASRQRTGWGGALISLRKKNNGKFTTVRALKC